MKNNSDIKKAQPQKRRQARAPRLSNEEIITQDTFERLKTRNRRKKAIRTVSCVLAGIVFCVIFVIICASVFFKVSEITVEGSTIYAAETVADSSDITLDENLYKIDFALVETNITMRLPYIKSVELKRVLPSTVEIIVTEDKPKYYLEISGEYFILSDTLRVLERVDDAWMKAYQFDLKELVLPPVSYAVSGRQLRFKKESNIKYITEVLDWISDSELYSGVSKINLSDKFLMYFIYDERYKITIGKNENLDIKLKRALQILNDESVAGQKGLIDVQDLSMNFAIVDSTVDLS